MAVCVRHMGVWQCVCCGECGSHVCVLCTGVGNAAVCVCGACLSAVQADTHVCQWL